MTPFSCFACAYVFWFVRVLLFGVCAGGCLSRVLNWRIRKISLKSQKRSVFMENRRGHDSGAGRISMYLTYKKFWLLKFFVSCPSGHHFWITFL